MKLKDAVITYSRYLEKQQFSESHLNTVRSRLGHFERRHPDKNVDDFTRDDLRGYFKALGVGRAEATMAGYAATHRAFWKFAKKKKWIKNNIGKKMRGYSYDPVHRRAAPEQSVRAVASSIQKFANHRNGNPCDLRDALFVSLAIDSGARLGEMRTLQKHAVRRALLQPTVAENGHSVFHIIGNGKTGGSHLRFFNGTAVLFQRWLNEGPHLLSIWVFYRTSDGELMSDVVLSRAFGRVCKFANVPPFRSHALRKRNVSQIIGQSRNPKMGQHYANHKSIVTTNAHYNDFESDAVDDAAAALAATRWQDERDEYAKLFSVK